MKKIILFILLFVLLTAACFIPVSQQKTISIKSPFITVFSELQNAENWGKWRADLRNVLLTDSDKILIKTLPGSFTINYVDLALDVKLVAGSFKVKEKNNAKNINYDLTVLPGETPVNSLVVVRNSLPLIKYLKGIFNDDLLKSSHIIELKNFMETDSLYYGCNIFKSRVPGENLIVIRKEVLRKDEFTEASKSLSLLRDFARLNKLTQIRPLIAQFVPAPNDSIHVNVGFFVDRETQSTKYVTFNRMPKGGALYSALFYGPFNKRQKVYIGIRHFFADKRYQSAVSPFETYLDDKLPVSDTSKIKIQVNFTAYF